jgi:short-subunit dehydrogenase
LLILCAGIGDLNENLEYKAENKTNQLNVIAFTEIVDWTFNFFKQQGRGHLVVISSVAGLRGNRDAPAYSASKAYQINYLEGLRQKAQKTHLSIKITEIRPGYIDTDMAKGNGIFWESTKEKAANQIFKLIQKSRTVCYVTKRWRLIAIILKILPNRIYDRI